MSSFFLNSTKKLDAKSLTIFLLIDVIQALMFVFKTLMSGKTLIVASRETCDSLTETKPLFANSMLINLISTCCWAIEVFYRTIIIRVKELPPQALIRLGPTAV